MTDIKNADKPANPTHYCDFTNAHGGSDEFYSDNEGLTKREAFAMAAMQNVTLNYNPWEQGDFDSSNYKEAAKQAVGLADALLKELAK